MLKITQTQIELKECKEVSQWHPALLEFLLQTINVRDPLCLEMFRCPSL